MPGTTATRSSTPTSPGRSWRRSRDDAEPLVMLHDYHLYTCPALIREARPDALLHHFVHIPWSQPDSWRILPGRMREEIYRGLLANDIIGFHTTAYCRNFLHCCRELMELEVDYERGAILHAGRETWVRAYPLGIDAGRLERAAASPRGGRVRAGAAAPPPRPPDPPRRPRRPVEERAARLHRLRHLPPAASRVPRAGDLHRPPAAVADRRPRVRRVPGADRGAGRGGQPPPRDHRLDADRPADLRELPRGRRPLQALRPADRQLAVRRHEPGRQGGARR